MNDTSPVLASRYKISQDRIKVPVSFLKKNPGIEWVEIEHDFINNVLVVRPVNESKTSEENHG